MGKAAVVTAIALVGLGPARAAGQAPSPPATVQSAGPWFEIARIPNRFQKDCARNVTARYTLKDDGDITVLNRCTKPDGSGDEAEGVARIVDRESNAAKGEFRQLRGLATLLGPVLDPRCG
jgi:apolipoprotein D and lipocalin family protein